MTSCVCRSCLTFLLKFLNYLQGLIGISIALYSVWMLGSWNHRTDLQQLPFPWFIYPPMGVGLLFCLISYTGYLTAGMANNCCLFLYALLITILILLEAALVADLMLNQHWEEDLPHDAVGEHGRFHKFVGENFDVSKYVAICVFGIQVFCLPVALVLRITVHYGSLNYATTPDSDMMQKPLLDPECVLI
ncbi:hypothetical protein HPP92_027233 [Vanilla planifolia]|uniref:Tetraspanin-19 n=1 Tax=Vanilla planifolia TaxID=51239 RepID=A0A835PFS1_VANPL|nr:hypothetical protein HPP92_027233 [Vanilla planifolia]KAG0449598.1 hypothetical protein HPP92_027299 [Vanilla planifolia]